MKFRDYLIAALFASALQGCATTASAPLTQEDFSALIDKTGVQADGLAQGGKLDEAVGLLSKMAQENPARKEPWLKMAKIYFDAADYGNAIVSADEVLQRDKSDQTAKGIRAVSGLRVATQALGDLRGDSNLKGSARSDAISLVKTLRETLGEDVLVPPTVTAKSDDASAAVQPRKRIHVRTSTQRKSPTPVTPPQPTASGDPFSALR